MIQIAIMGLGTVGTGVAKVVAENAKQIERKLGEPLQVKTMSEGNGPPLPRASRKPLRS